MNLTSSLKRRLPLVLTGGMLAALTALPASASAAAPSFVYGGTAGGTHITALGTTITSETTAYSRLTGYTADSAQNQSAEVDVSRLVKVGAVTTEETGDAFGDGSQIVSQAKVAGISLLNGLIKADALQTTATASGSSTSAPVASVSSQLIGLKIAGKKYPANVRQNTRISIAGIATITINYGVVGTTPDGAATIGQALKVTLLRARSGAPAGAEIDINPVYAAVNRYTTSDNGLPVGGSAYGSYVLADVGGSIKVESAPTARLNIPTPGTTGMTLTNTTARVSLPGVIRTGAIDTSGSGIQSTALSQATDSSSIANLNLFNGLITARAITANASTQVRGGTSGTATFDGSLDFVNLRIAGRAIPVNVPANTTINVARLGAVTINEQTISNTPGTARVSRVIGLHITLDTARAGLPVGAEVQVAYASAAVYG